MDSWLQKLRELDKWDKSYIENTKIAVRDGHELKFVFDTDSCYRVTLETTLIKLQRHLDKTTLAFMGFLKSQLSDCILTVHTSVHAMAAKRQQTTAVLDYARDL